MEDLEKFVEGLLLAPTNATLRPTAGASPESEDIDCDGSLEALEHLSPGASQQYLDRWADEVAVLQAIYDSDMTCIAEGAAADVVRMFHGTAMRNVHSIVRQGLVVPGDASGVAVANGSTFGQGIYLSPDPTFSIHYCCFADVREHRLLVCAALPGVPERVTRGQDRRSELNGAKFDCRVSPNELEWIFFDAAQVLPCYVIHFHEERLRGFMYHDLSAAGALVKVHGERARAPPLGAAEVRASEDEEAPLAEMAARKRAEFYFGKRFQVIDWSAPDDDDDSGEQMWYRDATCSYLTEDGDEGEYTAEYQVARFGWTTPRKAFPGDKVVPGGNRRA